MCLGLAVLIVCLPGPKDFHDGVRILWATPVGGMKIQAFLVRQMCGDSKKKNRAFVKVMKFANSHIKKILVVDLQ